MSQNRHAAKDRAAAQHDYEVNLKAELEILACIRRWTLCANNNGWNWCDAAGTNPTAHEAA